MIQYNNQRFSSLIVTYKFGETNLLICRNTSFISKRGELL